MRSLFFSASAFLITLVISLTPAQAREIIQVPARADVATTADALEAAVAGAGATVFARVDHSAGAAGVGADLAPSQLLIFGNPKVGTPAMQANALAGLLLPMRVLVYEDAAGDVWLAYEDPSAMLGALEGTKENAEYLKKMTGALKKLTAAAAGG